MDSTELKKNLLLIRELCLKNESSKKMIDEAMDELLSAQNYEPTGLIDFDLKTKSDYILKKCGKRPILKWKQKEYDEKAKDAEREYYRVYSNERELHRLRDQQDKKERINQAQLHLEQVKYIQHDIERILDSENFLPKSFYDIKVLDLLIEAVEVGLACSEKDLLNLGNQYIFYKKQNDLILKFQETINARLSKIEDLISSNIVSVHNIETEIDDIKDEINNINNRINAISDEIDDIDVGSDVDDSIEDLSNSIDEIKSIVERMEFNNY